MIWLIRAVDRDVEITGLTLAERRQLDIKLRQVSPRNLFVELFGKHVHPKREFLRSSPKRDLRQYLIRE